ncbi:MAG: ATP synthase F1 subunit delta [Candidatus Izemoplasmatales bacterium]|jgi:F-type H+-transporting ATPase subunit delta|nr:ATP synthase F1 subunit delta [Candidatus Izemoplasmatales bacterium]
MTDAERQYARAVFSLALEKQEVMQVYDEMIQFRDSLSEDTWKFFLHPKIEISDKHNVIDKTIKNSLLANFLKVILDNNRFPLFELITYAYHDLINEMNNVVEVKVLSNIKLNENNLEKLRINLEAKLLKKVKITQDIDKNIVGGIRIEYLGNVIDQTINASLKTIKDTLTGGN